MGVALVVGRHGGTSDGLVGRVAGIRHALVVLLLTASCVNGAEGVLVCIALLSAV